MGKYFLLLSCVYLVLVLVQAKPFPQKDNLDQEDLEAKDTIPYVFWLGRPVYEQYDDGGDNTYYNLQPERRSSTLSYASVGAGWGR